MQRAKSKQEGGEDIRSEENKPWPSTCEKRKGAEEVEAMAKHACTDAGEEWPRTGEKREGEEVKEEPNGDLENRLRGLLRSDAKNLNKDDVDDVIRYLKVEEIVELALESSKEAKSKEVEDDRDGPSLGQRLSINRRMAYHEVRVNEAEFCLFYGFVPHSILADTVSLRVGCYNTSCGSDKERLVEFGVKEHAFYSELCRVLHYNLFAHVFNKKTGLLLYDSSADGEAYVECNVLSKKAIEEAEAECDPVFKEAARKCPMCLGKGRHSRPNGHFCSFRVFVPKGATVGAKYEVVCRRCFRINQDPVDDCGFCGSEGGKARISAAAHDLFFSLYLSGRSYKD